MITVGKDTVNLWFCKRTEQQACDREEFYIKNVYHSLVPNGYNVAEGGTSGRKLVSPIIQYFNGTPVNFFEGHMQAASERQHLFKKQSKLIAYNSKTFPYTGFYLPRLSVMPTILFFAAFNNAIETQKVYNKRN